MLENRMKSQLLSNKPAFGVSIMVPSPQLVEMVAKLGFDWVRIDCFDFIIHVFTPKSRDFYSLERRWGSAERVEV